jgi:tRNA(Ile2) C34 agmatinyltransferase TiaS
MLKLSKYGVCHRCQSPIEIPGLDGFKCSKCGWMRRPEYEPQLPTDINQPPCPRERGYKRRKSRTSTKVLSTPTEDSQPSLWD